MAFAQSIVETTRKPRSIEVDALVRIPQASFKNKAWAQHSVQSALHAITQAMKTGEAAQLGPWVATAIAGDDGNAMRDVLSAVCEALLADTFQQRGDITSVAAWIADFEHIVRTEMIAQKRRKDEDSMNDPDKAELAASLVRVVQMHDKETAVHLEATAVLARRVAEAMGLSDEQIRNTELAALLHDVGKVGIRREVLTKTSALTAEEWQEMRLHPESGAALLIDMPKLAYLAPIVRAHHERIDGYGYPDHLRADEIPVEARVIAVADAFHAMTTSRPYRKAMMPNDALAILADNAGTQFDRDVVAAMLRLFRFSVESHRAIA